MQEFVRIASEAMRHKTATLTNPASAKATSVPQPAVACTPCTPVQKGKPVSEEAVGVRAYEKWESVGRPGGEGVKFWLEAEHELMPAQ